MVVWSRGYGGLAVILSLLGALQLILFVTHTDLESNASLTTLPTIILAKIFLLTAFFLIVFLFLTKIARTRPLTSEQQASGFKKSLRQTFRAKPHSFMSIDVVYWVGIFITAGAVLYFKSDTIG